MAALDPVALAVPVFTLAVFGEWWLARRSGRATGFHFGTAVSDVACGATYQALEVVLRVVTVGVYAGVYEHARLVDWSEASPWPWVLGLLGIDLAYYAWHRVSHVVNAMWAVHAVHHHSQDYNLAVALRQPLLEPLTWTPFFCGLALLGVPTEVALASFGANMFFQFWLHTELVRKLPRPIEWLFNTPSHHRVHHGIEAEYLDKNYGGVLIVWDRLLGTFEPERRTPTYGTTHPLRSFDPLWANAAEWVRIAGMVRAGSGWRGVLRALVAHPAWQPSGRSQAGGGTVPTKYRPSLSRRSTRQAIIAVVLTSVGLVVLMALQPSLSTGGSALGFVAVMTAYVAVAARLERKVWAGRATAVAVLVAIGFAWVVA